MRGLTITVNDDRTYLVTEFDGDLAELQAAVGGLVTVAPSSDEVTIWVNDEGKLLDLPFNRVAMDVWLRWDAYGCMWSGDWLAGNAVITGGPHGQTGETKNLPADARRWVLRVAQDAGAEIRVRSA